MTSTAQPETTTMSTVRPWTATVWIATVMWAAAAFAVVRHDYLRFQLAYYDLGNMVQAVWSTAHGRPLESTLSTGEQAVRLGGHVDPILALFAPLWFVAPTPLLLAGAQVVAVASGALPVYWLARRYLDQEPAAALLALSYLAYPWLAWTALDAVHPVTLVIPLLLFAIYFLDCERLVPFAVCASLALATNELAGLFVAGLGIWYWFARSRLREGAIIALAGLAWTAMCLKVVLPAFADGGNRFYSHYAAVGGSPTGIARTLVTDPGAIVDAVTSTPDLAYAPWLLLPLLGSPLLAPFMAALALPQVLINVLADLGSTTDPRHHYVAGAIPFLFAASALGLRRLRERAVPFTLAVLGVNIALTVALGPWPGIGGDRPRFHDLLSDAHAAALRSAVELVPDDAAVSSTNVAASHLAARRYVFLVPIVKHASWIVLDTSDDYMGVAGRLPEGRYPERLRAFHSALGRSAQWREVFARDGVFVYRRTD